MAQNCQYTRNRWFPSKAAGRPECEMHSIADVGLSGNKYYVINHMYHTGTRLSDDKSDVPNC